MSRLCEDCGKPLFFNYHCYSSDANGHRYHHGDCDGAARAVDDMPRAHDALVQRLIEIGETAGAAMFETDEEIFAQMPVWVRKVLLKVWESSQLGGLTAQSQPSDLEASA